MESRVTIWQAIFETEKCKVVLKKNADCSVFSSAKNLSRQGVREKSESETGLITNWPVALALLAGTGNTIR
jgi:hypothetical protein